MRTRLALFIFALLALVACGRKANLIIPGTVLPKPVTGLSAEPKGSAVIISWTMPDKNTRDELLTDLAGFMVLRAEIPLGEKGCPCNFEQVGNIDLEFPKDAVVEGKKVVWADRSGIIFGRKYIYRVIPYNKDGFSGEPADTRPVNFLMPPGKPRNIKADAGNKEVELSWEKVTIDENGDKMDDFSGYNIYRHEKGAAPARINNRPIGENKYMDTGLVNRETYCYSITAVRGTELPYTEGERSAEACATPKKVLAPAPPAGLQAVPGEGTVMLSWEPSFEADIAGYNLYRQEGDSTPKKLNASLLVKTTYTDKDVKAGTKYIYYVTAVDNAVPPNESAPSGKAEATVGL